MMRGVMMAFGVMLAACAPAPEPEQPAMSNAAVPAPTPQDVSVRITAEQAGQTIEVPLNARFAVELVGVPTAGYVWTPAQIPPFIARAGEAGGDTTEAQSQPGFTGGNHWEVLMFVATAPGTGEIVIEQRRPWETDGAPADTFRVTVTAR